MDVPNFTRAQDLPPLHLFRTELKHGRYFTACIGCSWKSRIRRLLRDAEQDGRLHCQTANLAEQAKLKRDPHTGCAPGCTCAEG